MPTLNEYFRSEARDFLTALERSLQSRPAPDAAEMHRAVRGLRGTAQMAREQRIFDVVSAFEGVTGSIADGALAWSDSVAERARATIADLRMLLDPTEEDEELDARVSGAAARWSEAALTHPPAPSAPEVVADTGEFREFAAREAAGIADTLDRGIADLQANPMDRDPLTAILRRQRVLLGAARLDEIPVVADILRAVEDLTRVIVKLDVGVKKEWLDIYRVARDALQTTIAPLLRDELPQSSNAVSRLRHMREELLGRYGSTVEGPPGPEDPLAPQTLSHPAAPFLAGVSAPPAMFAPGAAEATEASGATGAHEATEASGATGAHEATDSSAAAPPVLSSSPAIAVARPEVDADVARNDHELQLDTEDIVDDTADELELDTDDIIEFGADDIVDEDTDELQLGDDDVVDEDADELQLGDDDVVDEDTDELQLGADDVVDRDADELQLGADDVVDRDADELQLGADDVIDRDADELQLGADHVVDTDADELQLGEDDIDAEDDRGHALARALELRPAIERAASHDPQARTALDELYVLIRRALG